MNQLGGYAVGEAEAPTIDEIDLSETPSLVGYWKMGDITAERIKDYSGNGYDLLPYNTEEAEPWNSAPIQADSWARYPGGYAHLTKRTAYLAKVNGTLLDTQGKFIVFGGEAINAGSSDTDFGTAWAGGHLPTGTPSFTGWNIGGFGSIWNCRAIWDEGATQHEIRAAQWNGIVDPPAGLVADETIVMAAGFKPSSSPVAGDGVFYGSSLGHKADGSIIEVDETSTTPVPGTGTIPDTLVAQTNGTSDAFCGYRSTSYNASPMKNVFIWAFDSEPSHMEETVAWLARNPGKIPPWWIGR